MAEAHNKRGGRFFSFSEEEEEAEKNKRGQESEWE